MSIDSNQTDNSPALLEARRELYLGPLPPPEMLRQYHEINPEYPERIFKMVEAHVAADIVSKNRKSASILRGQILSFALGVVGLGVSGLFALKGFEAGAITAVLGGISPIIISALSNLKKK